jgi:hypothetical protein
MAVKTAAQKETPETDNRPVHELKLGRLKAAIWKNQTENGVRFNVTFSRLYKDREEKWRDTDSFGRDDLLLLGKLADQVHTWIFEQTAGQGQGGGPRSDDEIAY